MSVEKHQREGSAGRLAFFDSIRVVLTALVIFHHSASTYGGAGSWYWREQASNSSTALVAFNAINQSFFMGFFFLIAGYFTVPALAGHGATHFMRGRLIRLGIPLLVFFFIISPFTVALAEIARGEPLLATFLFLIKSAQFEPGPLWFVMALLIFSGIYAALIKLFDRFSSVSALPAFHQLALAGIATGIVSFVVRLWMPVGESVFWLQLGYFPLYAFFYFSGCVAYRERVLECIVFKKVLPWILVSALALVSLPFALKGALGDGAFEGGFSLNAFYYALWDPAVAFGVVLGMLWLFRRFFNDRSKVVHFLGRRAYAVYIIHPPVLVAVALLLSNWAVHPILKTLVAGL
ncbi:MAG TPA: acyltransferase family protein, partial [Marinagarivorans sp.]